MLLPGYHLPLQLFPEWGDGGAQFFLTAGRFGRASDLSPLPVFLTASDEKDKKSPKR